MQIITQPATKQVCVIYDVSRDGATGTLATGLYIPNGSLITSIYQKVITQFASAGSPLCSFGSDSQHFLYTPQITFIPTTTTPTAMFGGQTGWILYDYPTS